MMNVFQINHATDSLVIRRRTIQKTYSESLKNQHPYFNKATENVQDNSGMQFAEEAQSIQIASLPKLEQKMIANRVVSLLRNSNKALTTQIDFIATIDHESDLYWIEFHRKFALTYAIIVLFFVGAPLGAIIRKGGFGAPVVIAAIIFMIYFIITSIGENLANTFVVSPFFGMWIAGIFFTPIAFLITYAAANDTQLFSIEGWKSLLKRKK